MRTAPSELDYNPYKTPLAISSESKRVSFLPTNNGDFEYGKTQVISIDINSDSYLDVAQSYLKATITNLGRGPLCLESGPCWLKRVVVKNSGTVLEDINEYHRLYAIMTAAQTNDNVSTQSIYTNEEGCYHATMRPNTGCALEAVDSGDGSGEAYGLNDTIGTMAADQSYGRPQLPTWSTNVTTTPAYPCPKAKFMPTTTTSAPQIGGATYPGTGNPADGWISAGPHGPFWQGERGTPGGVLNGTDSKAAAAGVGQDGATWGSSANGLQFVKNPPADDLKGNDSYTMCFPIISCLFNSDTFLPLLLTTAGITLELHLASPDEVGVAYLPNIQVKDIKTILHPASTKTVAEQHTDTVAALLTAKTQAQEALSIHGVTPPAGASSSDYADFAAQALKLTKAASDAKDKYDKAVAEQAAHTAGESTAKPTQKVGTLNPDYFTPQGYAESAVTTSPYDVAKYKVTNVEFVGHTIILPNDFDANLRNQVAASGSLSTHGTCYKHYSSTFNGEEQHVSLNIPARMKSIKSILSTFRDQSTGAVDRNGGTDGELAPLPTTDWHLPQGASTSGYELPGSRFNPFSSVHGTFPISTMSQMGIKQYGLRVGSAQFPERDILLDATGYCGNYDADPMQKPGQGIAECFCETLRAFGKLGLTDKTTTWNRSNYAQTGNTVNSGPGDFRKQFVMGFDVESFGRSVIESGIDTASRALPIQLHFERDKSVGQEGNISQTELAGITDADTAKIGGVGAYCRTDKLLEQYNPGLAYVMAPKPQYVQADTYVMSDCWMFWNADGTITPSV